MKSYNFNKNKRKKFSKFQKVKKFFTNMNKKESSNNTEPCECENKCDIQSQVEAAEAADTQRLADDMTAGEEAMNLTDLENRLDAAEAEAEKNKDLYMRTVADLDTYRRKVQREKQELAKFALQPLIEELLPSLDHLDMAIQASKTAGESQNLIVGVEMVNSQMRKVLTNFGVEEVDALGKEFDPNSEECVSHEPSEEVPENHVIKVVRAGYKFNGRLIRPASVVVSSGNAKA